MKNLILIIIAALLFNLNTSAAEFKIPDVKAYILTEAETGQILYAYNEDERLPVSSLAKIMTLLLIAQELEAGNIALTDDVPASLNAHNAKGSVIWLNPGEVMKLGELVKAVVIASSNDATIALAEYISGSAEKFTEKMNRRAAELGLKGSYFADVGGFDEKSVSTAHDIAVITAELFRHDVFNEHFTTRLSAVREYTEREAQLLNTNKLAYSYEGILGGKAGQSQKAGFCLANCAVRNNMKLIAVVIGAKTEEDRVDLSRHLLNSGFHDFEFVTPEPETEKFSPVKVERGVAKTVETGLFDPVRFVAVKGGGKNARFIYTMPESVTAPVEEGQIIGRLSVEMDGRRVAESDIVALYAVQELTFMKSLEIILEKIFVL